jgi:hypothetical protein
MADNNTTSDFSAGADTSDPRSAGYGTIASSSNASGPPATFQDGDTASCWGERPHECQYADLSCAEIIDILNAGGTPFCAKEKADEHRRRARIWAQAGVCGTGITFLSALVGSSGIYPGAALAVFGGGAAVKEWVQSRGVSGEQDGGSTLTDPARATIHRILARSDRVIDDSARRAEEGRLSTEANEGTAME